MEKDFLPKFCTKQNPVTKARFHTINQSEWPNAGEYYYYTKMAPTIFSITVKLKVTSLRKELKNRGLKFFPAYIHIVTDCLRVQKEFMLAEVDGVLGYWDALTPAYPIFHEKTGTNSLMWTEFDSDFKVFYQQYIEETTKHKNDLGLLTEKGIPPQNNYMISCIPWYSFESFSVTPFGGANGYFMPCFEAGGFVEENGEIFMPLSATVHHAGVNGWRLKFLFEAIRGKLDNLDWIDG